MRVLMAIDGSAGGFEAVRFTGRLLSVTADRIAFYYSPPDIRLKQTPAPEPGVVERARLALAQAVFDEARLQLPEPLRAAAETIVGSRAARAGVIVAADRWKADMIVLGARGLGPIQRLLLGSVSSSVALAASVPVLVVRPQPAAREAQGLKVLLACADGAAGEPLAKVLRNFTWPANAAGRTITVVPSVFCGQVPKWLEEKARSEEVEAMAQAWVKEHDAELAAKREEMSRCCQQWPEPFHRCEPLVVEGQPADQILAALAKEHDNLAVVGAREANPLSQLLLGSTANAVLNHAPCSVLVVHERPGA